MTAPNRTKQQHTPGPWIIEPRGNLQARQYIEAGEFRIAECLNRDQDANARLIAAAPELLAALKRARRYVVLDVTEDNATARRTLEVVDEAVAKAEGHDKR